MDWVEFAKRGRELTADSKLLMLTGNQDPTTAVKALNEGSVSVSRATPKT